MFKPYEGMRGNVGLIDDRDTAFFTQEDIRKSFARKGSGGWPIKFRTADGKLWGYSHTVNQDGWVEVVLREETSLAWGSEEVESST